MLINIDETQSHNLATFLNRAKLTGKDSFAFHILRSRVLAGPQIELADEERRHLILILESITISGLEADAMIQLLVLFNNKS